MLPTKPDFKLNSNFQSAVPSQPELSRRSRREAVLGPAQLCLWWGSANLLFSMRSEEELSIWGGALPMVRRRIRTDSDDGAREKNSLFVRNKKAALSGCQGNQKNPPFSRSGDLMWK